VREESVFAVNHIYPELATPRCNRRALRDKIAHDHYFGQLFRKFDFAQKIAFSDYFGIEQILEVQTVVMGHPARVIGSSEAKRILGGGIGGTFPGGRVLDVHRCHT
jgi:hypothetical protein